MLQKLQITRTRAVVAAAVATATVSGFTLAWANTSPSSDPAAAPRLASSSEAPGDVSGPCDELENAAKPECAGSQTVDAGTAPAPSPTPPTGSEQPAPAAPTAPDAPATAADLRSFAAADAGTVTYAVEGGTLTLVEAAPAAGWRVEVEQSSGRELDLDFRSGTRRVQVDVEFEDGSVRERVRTRDDADDSRTEMVNGTVTEVDDDNSGPGGGGSDDDSSGPGGGDSDDDNSGPGGGDSDDS